MTFGLGTAAPVKPLSLPPSTWDTGLIINTLDTSKLDNVDPCWGNPDNWGPKKGSDGKCYFVCKTNPQVGYETYLDSCASAMPGWMPWAIGGGVLLLVVVMAGR